MFSVRYRRYVLGVLTLIYTLNYLDRILITLFLQPIKDDLHLSDTQLGFITGIAFGLFYAGLGVPIARWADRGNRVTIASTAIALWGVTAMSCMFVVNFAQLLVARIAAAVGESGCMPPTYSLVGDYYADPVQRSRAMAVYTLGNSLSSLVGFILGGWLSLRYGWRMTFFAMGVPALLVAAVVRLTVVEPRSKVSSDRSGHQAVPRVVDVLMALWNRRSTRHLIVAIVLLYTVALGMAPWYAAFMMRSHGMSTAEVGTWLGLTFGLGGLVGTGLGGYVAGSRFARSERAQLRLSAWTVAALMPCFMMFLLIQQTNLAMAALLPLTVVFCFFLGPTFALLQRLVRDDMRATVLALVMLFANLIGMGLGPELIGILSDWLSPAYGMDSLRYAMLAISLAAVWSGWHFWKAGQSVAGDLREVAA